MTGRKMSSAEIYTNGRGALRASFEPADMNASHTRRAINDHFISNPMRIHVRRIWFILTSITIHGFVALQMLACRFFSSGLPLPPRITSSRLPNKAGRSPCCTACLYVLFSTSVPSVCTTPSASGRRCAKLCGCSASPVRQSTCRRTSEMDVRVCSQAA